MTKVSSNPQKLNKVQRMREKFFAMNDTRGLNGELPHGADTAEQTGLEGNANTFREGRRARSRDQQVGEEHGGWRLDEIRKKEPQFKQTTRNCITISFYETCSDRN